jgi:hypothetical protein
LEALEQQAAADKRAWQAAEQVWAQERIALQEAVEATRGQLIEARNAVLLAQAKLETSAARNKALAQKLSDAEQTLAASDSACQRARSERDERSAELEFVKQQLEQQAREIAELRTEAVGRAQTARAIEMNGDRANGRDTSQTARLAKPEGEAPPAQAVLSHDAKTDEARRGRVLSQPVETDPCPHLGLVTDHETRHGFASVKNRCYALESPLEVTFAQQDNTCLCRAHTQCLIFTGKLRSPRVPIHTQAEAAPGAKRRGPRWLTGR